MRLFPILLLAACAEEEDVPRVEVSPTALDLGGVPVGKVGTASLTIMNQGPGIARIGTITLSESAGRLWSLVRADTTDLFPGATSEVEVAFTPQMAQSSQTQLVIRSNDPVNQVLGVPLIGVGERVGFGVGDDTGWIGGPGGVGDMDADDDGDGRSEGDGDCDDGDATVFPGAEETCDTVDEDCSGVADDLDDDGDGHSPCDAGGDCDDTDPAAFPVVVEAGAEGTADGTLKSPFATLSDALANLDAVCRTVVLLPGTHAASVAVDSGAVTVRGGGAAAEVLVTPPVGSRAFTVGPLGQLTLERLTLQGARGTAGDGGALYVEGEARLAGVRAVDNRSSEAGGAIGVREGTLTLDGCVLTGNQAAGDGGALYAWDATVSDVGSAWVGNVARDGGAAAVRRSDFTTTGATWSGNTAEEAGGALVLRDGDHTLERGAFEDNVAAEHGGAVLVDDTARGTLRNNLVVGNRAGESGGGIAVTGTPDGFVIANNTLVGNEASGHGGGVYVSTGLGTSLVVASNIVAGSGGQSGVWVGTDAEGVSIAYMLAYTNAGEDFDLGWSSDDGDNEVCDPLFERWSDDGDATNDVYTLTPGSPAIDSGPDDGSGADGYTDWADPDGSRNDRGYTGGAGAG